MKLRLIVFSQFTIIKLHNIKNKNSKIIYFLIDPIGFHENDPKIRT